MVSLTLTPENVAFGETVVITCEAIAVPLPTYTIIHNDSEIVSTQKTYIITVLEYSHSGSYKCFARNVRGNSSKTLSLSVRGISCKTLVVRLFKQPEKYKANFDISTGALRWDVIAAWIWKAPYFRIALP